MHPIDWAVVILPLLVVIGVGLATKRHLRGVADFLTGGRLAGRYLLTVSAGEAGLGLITVIATFESMTKGGLALGYWGILGTIVTMVITLSGFAIYRYRETRAMTTAQFLEMRYSRRFRIFAGILSYIAGVVNYGLFPAVAGRFLCYYCGLPETTYLLGLEVSTYGLVMAVFLSIALILVLWGGLLTVIVVDCLQGMFGYIGYAVLVIAILCFFSFDQFQVAMTSKPPGESFINPFDTGKLTDFNLLFVIIGIIGIVYHRLSWAGGQGFNAAAESPHEQKMAGVLASWRGGFSGMMIMMLVVGAFTFMNHPDFAEGAKSVHAELSATINFDNPATTETIRNQMLVPTALKHILPVGAIGVFAAVLIFMMIACDTSYLHSWGSLLVQDVILPLRKKPFTPEQQLRLLRLSILGVAAFAWLFSFHYGQVTYIFMFFAITGAIYLGGAGAVILGGLYWRRGTTAGAWAALITGSVVGLSGLATTQFWASGIHPWLTAHAPDLLATFGAGIAKLNQLVPLVRWEMTPNKFPISGVELGFLAVVASVGIYVVVSLITSRQPFDLNRMLHRGAHDVANEHRAADPIAKQGWKEKILGISTEFTRGDRILAWSVFLWTMLNLGLWVFQLLSNVAVGRWSTVGWFQWWKYYTIPSSLLVGAVTTVWFICGGYRDLRRFFNKLSIARVDMNDDGRVVDSFDHELKGSEPTASDSTGSSPDVKEAR